MSTTARALTLKDTAYMNKCMDNQFAPQEKTTRQIVREEIQRQKQLDKLEEKYQNGEISKFEYKVQKTILNMPNLEDIVQPSFSTTA